MLWTLLAAPTRLAADRPNSREDAVVDADLEHWRVAGTVPPFVERFASVLTEAGVPRMPARVFAALMCTDSGSLTAADLADMLMVSSGGISGAVRYLMQVNLASRHATP